MQVDENVIVLRAGENRAATMPAHNGAQPGLYTFTIAGLDMDKPTQWSVIGARDSEMFKTDSSKEGVDKCIIHIPEDQSYEAREPRVIDVSVIGTDVTTKQLVETHATLTLNIVSLPDSTDFSFYTHVPSNIVKYKESDGTLDPVLFEVKAHLSEQAVETGGVSNFTATCTFDVQGAYKVQTFPMTLMPGGATSVFKGDLTKRIKDAAAAWSKLHSTLECTYEIEIHKHHLDDFKDSYYQVQGGSFIIQRIPNDA